MKTRLLAFVAALLLLPPAGFLLGGHEWDELAAPQLSSAQQSIATALTLLALMGCMLLASQLVRLRTGNNPLASQRNYYLAMAAASAATGWLLAYLNLYAASWIPTSGGIAGGLLDTLLFAALAPAVLSLRALLGSFPWLLKRLARGPRLPAPAGEMPILALAAISAMGLLGGGAWPELFWLLWLAPLLLLLALQLLWHESTVFSGLKSRDWGRVVCAALAGLAVGNLAVSAFRAAGGALETGLPVALPQLGFALFGLLCLQLGDVIAEQWRGTQRGQPGKPRKKFPIPVVVKRS